MPEEGCSLEVRWRVIDQYLLLVGNGSTHPSKALRRETSVTIFFTKARQESVLVVIVT